MTIKLDEKIIKQMRRGRDEENENASFFLSLHLSLFKTPRVGRETENGKMIEKKNFFFLSFHPVYLFF